MTKQIVLVVVPLMVPLTPVVAQPDLSFTAAEVSRRPASLLEVDVVVSVLGEDANRAWGCHGSFRIKYRCREPP